MQTKGRIAVASACCLALAGCATLDPQRASDAPGCAATTLSLSFISDIDASFRSRVEDSAQRLTTMLSSPSFATHCREQSMNRRDGRSVEQVCQHLACAGPQELKIALYRDASMPTAAFEKRGAVFLNAAKPRAGEPGNLAHEFAHVLGYTHVSWWSWRREGSVPYVLGRIVDELDSSP